MRIVFFGLMGILLAGGTAMAAGTTPGSDATVRQIMLALTKPTSDAVFQVAAKAPKTDEEWEIVEANAMSLAESGRLLLGKRAVDAADWTKQAQAMIAASLVAARSAHDKDAERVENDGNTIYDTCDACHMKYMAARQGK